MLQHQAKTDRVPASGLFKKEPHCAMIVGATGCGKTVFMLDLLETEYRNNFTNVVIICPTFKVNTSYQSCRRGWIYTDDNVFVVIPLPGTASGLDDCLDKLHRQFSGKSTLFILDDCSNLSDITKKKRTLSALAFSGRHHEHSVWILTQKYNAVLKDFRDQLKWIAIFYCKDRDSFEDCLRENDVIPTRERREDVKQRLLQTLHAKLILKTEQPVCYQII